VRERAPGVRPYNPGPTQAEVRADAKQSNKRKRQKRIKITINLVMVLKRSLRIGNLLQLQALSIRKEKQSHKEWIRRHHIRQDHSLHYLQNREVVLLLLLLEQLKVLVNLNQLQCLERNQKTIKRDYPQRQTRRKCRSL
jgi:hypothetical protein